MILKCCTAGGGGGAGAWSRFIWNCFSKFNTAEDQVLTYPLTISRLNFNSFSTILSNNSWCRWSSFRIHYWSRRNKWKCKFNFSVTITSAGGGGGKRFYRWIAGSGGSGGGGSKCISGGTGNTPPVSPPQGNTGGAGVHKFTFTRWWRWRRSWCSWYSWFLRTNSCCS